MSFTDPPQAAGAGLGSSDRDDVFDAMPVGLMQLDASGRIERANPAMGRLLGRGVAELRGRLVFDCLEIEQAQRLRERLSFHQGPDAEGFEMELGRSDVQRQGCTGHVARLLDAQGDAAGWIFSLTPLPVLRGVLDQRWQYEIILNAIDESISVVDKDGVFCMVNDAWCRQHRMSRAQVVGCDASKVFRGIDLSEATPPFRVCLHDRRATRAFIDVDSPEGVTSRVRLDFYPFGDDVGESPHVLIIERLESQGALASA